MRSSAASSVAWTLCWLLAAACQRGSMAWGPEDFRPLIMRYNQALVEAYAANDASIMKSVTSDRDMEGTAKLIEGLKAHRVRMLASLRELRITGVKKADPTSAVIFTEERWDYEYRALATGETRERKSAVVYTMAYVVMMRGQSWAITKAAYRDEFEHTKENAELP